MPHIDKPYRHHTRLGENIAQTIHFVWNPVTRWLGKPCSWLITQIDQIWLYILIVLLIVTVGVVTWDFALYYGSSWNVDWLWITGYPVSLYVLFRSTDLPNRIYYLRQSLVNQRILDIYDPQISPEPSLARERLYDNTSIHSENFLSTVKERVLPHTAVLTILICLSANYVIHLVGLYRVPPNTASTIQTVNAFANHALGHAYIFLLSLRLSRMVAFGILMWAHGLVRLSLPNTKDDKTLYRIRLDPQPGHPDGVCGLKNILDFWTFEAGLLVPPLIYTLAWLTFSGSEFCVTDFWILCDSKMGNPPYTAQPVVVYFWLSVNLITLQFLSLWWPVLVLRMRMGNARDIVKMRLDEIVKKTAELRFAVVNSKDAKTRKDAAEQIVHALESYQDYKNMPLWPISRNILKNHLTQLWTVLVFLGVVHQEEKIWPIIKQYLTSG